MNKVAVIDIGSNSVRLMRIADGTVLYKTIKTTRLGEGLAFSPSLKQEAMERTMQAISQFVAQERADGVQEIYAYATAAVRSAENGAEFRKKVFAACGVEVEVLSGEQEAQMGILGAIGRNDGAIIDVGGASTELIIQENGKIVYEKSLNIGVVRIRDLCARAQDKVRELSLKTVAEYGLEKVNGKVYAIGGTATTLGAIFLKLDYYDSSKITGLTLTRENVKAISKKLFSMTVEEISQLPCVDKLRADVLAGGVEWLYTIMEQLKISEIILSDGDNLEGYALTKGLLNA